MKFLKPPLTDPVAKDFIIAPSWATWFAKTYDFFRGISPGSVMPFAGATVPFGWLLCDGSAVSRTTYKDLFSAIGTTYGVGDGVTTFNLPNIAALVAGCNYYIKT